MANKRQRKKQTKKSWPPKAKFGPRAIRKTRMRDKRAPKNSGWMSADAVRFVTNQGVTTVEIRKPVKRRKR